MLIRLIELIVFNVWTNWSWTWPIKHIMLKWRCCIDKIPHTYMVAMGDPKVSMLSGSLQSLDWTGGLDRWTGLVD